MPLLSCDIISSVQNTDEIEMQKFYVFSINYLNHYWIYLDRTRVDLSKKLHTKGNHIYP